ncbi:MAG: pilus assembly protein [Candidatus Devosia phytovorans]|uniref:Pilus assembly protein n=1 Tax=Candidatus Devosia phytovorans TaxID=3121372 RepID=A0AAJ5VR64_9HYPH|nr:TadE/TadG family type IV pilus assembly protein [Devosia sp.]WEK03238.1 MAG: pilus assembly protein [Devosia sp.]
MMLCSLKSFLADRRGVSAVEFALLAPVMLVLLISSVTVFDLFRTAQSAEKGTFTVGDMLSRQTSISETQLKNMVTFIGHTVDFEGEARIRVSSISNIKGKLTSDWTKSVGNSAIEVPALSMEGIPDIAVGDSVLVTEVYVPHSSFLPIAGLDQMIYSNRAVHRPRFVGRVAFQ